MGFPTTYMPHYKRNCPYCGFEIQQAIWNFEEEKLNKDEELIKHQIKLTTSVVFCPNCKKELPRLTKKQALDFIQQVKERK